LVNQTPTKTRKSALQLAFAACWRKGHGTLVLICLFTAIFAADLQSNKSFFWSSAALAASPYKAETMTHMRAGVQFLRDHQTAKAKQQFELVVKMEPGLPDAFNNLGLAYAYENNNSKAESYYRQALNIEPAYVPALNNLGLILYSSGNPKEALFYWNKCLSLSSSNQADLHYYMANALRDIGQKDEAREHYLTAIKLKPESAAAYSGLAALDLSENHLSDALSEVKKSIKLKNDSAFSYYHLGLIEEKLGHSSEAVSAYQSSLKYETVPKYSSETKERIAHLSGRGDSGAGDGPADALKTKAAEELNHRDWSGAARDLEELARGSGAEDAVVWNNLGLALAGQSQNSNALAAYRRALHIRHDGFAEAQYNLGMVLRHMGDNAQAEAAFRQAIADSAKVGRSNPLAQNMLGIISRERGDFEAADKAFKLAIAQGGDTLPVAHYNRALLLEHTEHSRDAIKEYETYLSKSPRGKNAHAARERLKRLTGN